MKTMPYLVRLPKHLLELADLRAQDGQVDRSTALRQLLYAGATGYVLELLREGRISLSKAAELLACSTLAILEKSRERPVARLVPVNEQTRRPLSEVKGVLHRKDQFFRIMDEILAARHARRPRRAQATKAAPSAARSSNPHGHVND